MDERAALCVWPVLGWGRGLGPNARFPIYQAVSDGDTPGTRPPPPVFGVFVAAIAGECINQQPFSTPLSLPQWWQ